MKKIKNVKPLLGVDEKGNAVKKEQQMPIIPFSVNLQMECISECINDRNEYRKDAKYIAEEEEYDNIKFFNYMRDFSGGLMQTAVKANSTAESIRTAEVADNIPSRNLKVLSTDYWQGISINSERASRFAEMRIIQQEYLKISLKFFQNILPIIRCIFGDSFTGTYTAPVDRINNIASSLVSDFIRQYSCSIRLDDIYNQMLLLEGFDPELDDYNAIVKLIAQCLPLITLNIDSLIVNHISKVACAMFDLVYELLITIECSTNTDMHHLELAQFECDLVPILNTLQQDINEMFMNTLPLLIISHTAAKDYCYDIGDSWC